MNHNHNNNNNHKGHVNRAGSRCTEVVYQIIGFDIVKANCGKLAYRDSAYCLEHRKRHDDPMLPNFLRGLHCKKISV